MRFSTLSLPLLAAVVSAGRFHGGGQDGQNGQKPPCTFTQGGPVPTNALGSGEDGNIGQDGPGYDDGNQGFHSVPQYLPTPSGNVPQYLPTPGSNATPTTFETLVSSAPAAPTGTAPANGNMDADQQAALNAHNTARAEVNAVPLTWDTALASDAQAYAQVLASQNQMVHSGAAGQGENLYMSTEATSPLEAAVEYWNAEKPSNGGHYTQVVWKDTTKVGMGVAKGDTYYFVVARYSPQGNIY